MPKKRTIKASFLVGPAILLLFAAGALLVMMYKPQSMPEGAEENLHPSPNTRAETKSLPPVNARILQRAEVDKSSTPSIETSSVTSTKLEETDPKKRVQLLKMQELATVQTRVAQLRMRLVKMTKDFQEGQKNRSLSIEEMRRFENDLNDMRKAIEEADKDMLRLRKIIDEQRSDEPKSAQ